MVVRILIIKPGFGGGKNGKRYEILQKENPDFVLCMPEDVPEPIRGINHDGGGIQKGLDIIQNQIETFRPDILIAASRGGIYVSELLKRHQEKENAEVDPGGNDDFSKESIGKKGRFFVPPVLLIGALQTKAICEWNDGSQLALLCHGSKDDRNTIDRVRVDCSKSQVAELVEHDDGDHALTTVDKDLPKLIRRLNDRSKSAELLSEWKTVERTKWMESMLRPKIDEYEKRARLAREEVECHRHGHQPQQEGGRNDFRKELQIKFFRDAKINKE